MTIDTLVAAATVIGTGAGGFIGGRLAGKGSASQVASDTVDMLETQVNLLKADKENKDAELISLRSRVGVLENLVTQRAEVEELTVKVSLVKDTVDRIAERVGA